MAVPVEFGEGQVAMRHYIKLKMMEELETKYTDIMGIVAQHFYGKEEEKEKFGKVLKILLVISKSVLESEYAAMAEEALQSSEIIHEKVQSLMNPMRQILNVIDVVYAGDLDKEDSEKLFAMLEYMTVQNFEKIKEGFGPNQDQITKLHQERHEFCELLKLIRQLVLEEVFGVH